MIAWLIDIIELVKTFILSDFNVIRLHIIYYKYNVIFVSSSNSHVILRVIHSFPSTLLPPPSPDTVRFLSIYPEFTPTSTAIVLPQDFIPATTVHSS